MRISHVAAILLLIAYPLIASADEQLTPLAENGNWIAFAHRPSMSDAPDFCFATSVAEHLGFRADNNDIEIRYRNDSWSLPADVSGTITLSIQGHVFSVDITGNTNDIVMATVTRDQLQSILSDMNKASSLTLAAGSSKPIEVSLSGSNQAITAFLTCAGIDQPGNTGGDNPFK